MSSSRARRLDRGGAGGGGSDAARTRTTSWTASSFMACSVDARSGFRRRTWTRANELIPPDGVYATLATLDGVEYPSVTNIGVRPTFHLPSATVVETHVLDMDRDLYGKPMRVAFVQPHPRGEDVRRCRGPEGPDRRRLPVARATLLAQLSLGRMRRAFLGRRTRAPSSFEGRTSHDRDDQPSALSLHSVPGVCPPSIAFPSEIRARTSPAASWSAAGTQFLRAATARAMAKSTSSPRRADHRLRGGEGADERPVRRAGRGGDAPQAGEGDRDGRGLPGATASARRPVPVRRGGGRSSSPAPASRWSCSRTRSTRRIGRGRARTHARRSAS